MPDGALDVDMLAMIEILAHWKAEARDVNFVLAIQNKARHFGMSEEVQALLLSTATSLGMMGNPARPLSAFRGPFPPLPGDLDAQPPPKVAPDIPHEWPAAQEITYADLGPEYQYDADREAVDTAGDDQGEDQVYRRQA